MKTARIRSRCECQALLEATVLENGIVRDGTSTHHDGEAARAPATAIRAGEDVFQVGWSCPLCHRNTLRSFYRAALLFR